MRKIHCYNYEIKKNSRDWWERTNLSTADVFIGKVPFGLYRCCMVSIKREEHRERDYLNKSMPKRQEKVDKGIGIMTNQSNRCPKGMKKTEVGIEKEPF